MELPGERSFTLPSRGHSKQHPSLDDSALGRSHTSSRSSRSSRSSVTSQEGYLESMFRKECEVDDRMNDVYNDNIEEESEVFDEPLGTESESESSETDSEDEQIMIPKVKLKSESSSVHDNNDLNAHNDSQKTAEEEEDESAGIHAVLIQCHSIDSNLGNKQHDTFYRTVSPSEYTSELDRVIAREQSRNKSNTLNSQGSSDGHTSTHTSSSSTEDAKPQRKKSRQYIKNEK